MMKTNNPIRTYLAFIIFGFSLLARFANAQTYGGVYFPQGGQSFADEVVSYIIGTNAPTSTNHIEATKALGTPDYEFQISKPFCANVSVCSYVSLGNGGSITLRFTDNLFTRSGTTNDDLWIFEVGTETDATFVDISQDGLIWFPVGRTTGGTRGIDLDAVTNLPNVAFAYVRLTDEYATGNPTGPSLGADIDAVGAISSAPMIAINCSDSQCSGVQVCWTSVSNVLYQVEFRSELTANLWTALGTPLVGNGSTNCIVDSILGQPRRLYRIKVLP